MSKGIAGSPAIPFYLSAFSCSEALTRDRSGNRYAAEVSFS